MLPIISKQKVRSHDLSTRGTSKKQSRSRWSFPRCGVAVKLKQPARCDGSIVQNRQTGWTRSVVRTDSAERTPQKALRLWREERAWSKNINTQIYAPAPSAPPSASCGHWPQALPAWPGGGLAFSASSSRSNNQRYRPDQSEGDSLSGAHLVLKESVWGVEVVWGPGGKCEVDGSLYIPARVGPGGALSRDAAGSSQARPLGGALPLWGQL